MNPLIFVSSLILCTAIKALSKIYWYYQLGNASGIGNEMCEEHHWSKWQVNMGVSVWLLGAKMQKNCPLSNPDAKTPRLMSLWL